MITRIHKQKSAFEILPKGISYGKVFYHTKGKIIMGDYIEKRFGAKVIKFFDFVEVGSLDDI